MSRVKDYSWETVLREVREGNPRGMRAFIRYALEGVDPFTGEKILTEDEIQANIELIRPRVIEMIPLFIQSLKEMAADSACDRHGSRQYRENQRWARRTLRKLEEEGARWALRLLRDYYAKHPDGPF